MSAEIRNWLTHVIRIKATQLYPELYSVNLKPRARYTSDLDICVKDRLSDLVGHKLVCPNINDIVAVYWAILYIIVSHALFCKSFELKLKDFGSNWAHLSYSDNLPFVVCPSIPLNNLSSETPGAFFFRLHSVKGGLISCSNGYGPLTKMTTMPIYSKTLQNLLL